MDISLATYHAQQDIYGGVKHAFIYLFTNI